MHKKPDHLINDKLYVVTAIFNSHRFDSRWRLYHEFAERVAAAGAELYTVEVAFGDRAHAVTTNGFVPVSRRLQLRTRDELWHKEDALNAVIRNLPSDWKYVAWIDADVHFSRHDWVDATLHALQHHAVVQPWSEAHDLDPQGLSFQRHRSFCWSYYNDERDPLHDPYKAPVRNARGYNPWHPGFAWAMRRETYDALGGLLDFAILGAGDNHMAKAFIGDARYSAHKEIHPSYIDAVLRWEKEALRHVRKNIGYVDGLLLHYWHGTKASRQYWDRWKILVEHKFNPLSDLKRDAHGLWQLIDHADERSIRLRNRIRQYLSSRDEDSSHFIESERRF